MDTSVGDSVRNYTHEVLRGKVKTPTNISREEVRNIKLDSCPAIPSVKTMRQSKIPKPNFAVKVPDTKHSFDCRTGDEENSLPSSDASSLVQYKDF